MQLTPLSRRKNIQFHFNVHSFVPIGGHVNSFQWILTFFYTFCHYLLNNLILQPGLELACDTPSYWERTAVKH